jgi:hypothetical protein
LPAINTPVSASNTNTQAEDTVQNPTAVNTAPETKIVNVTLVFKGVNFDPNVLYDGLNTAYGTVASVKSSLARRTYIFQIEA